ncbi:MAG: DEAD/DEAH box helicase, partial [Victivallales bacterium]|nr:DEAD/DEAH box helicase [Victivallales bacterium]
RPASAPAGFQAVLRPYQQDGLGWPLAMGRAGLGVCLADDMGLGKTVQVLALLRQRQLEGAGGPSLVVMPKSLLGNWAAEAARFAPSLCCQFYVGAGRSLDDMAAADVVFTTYGTMRLDAEALSAVEFDYCILDESQAIKNAESSTAKAARTLRARHRLVMTGTPVENNLLELLSQLQFLNPGIFGQGRVAELGAGLEEAQLRRLRQLVRPLLLRRRKEDVAKDLPPRTEQTIFCEMGDRQKALYEELRDYYRQKFQEEGMEANKMEALAALLRLRQAACHPLLVNETLTWVESAKFDVLLAQLESILDGGHKALVFSQFTKLLHLLEPELRTRNWQFCYLDGQTADRQAVVADFQNNPDKRLFLISLKAGGTGLNLTAADYVFLLDPWWNPAVEAQAVDRAYRIGQTRPVFAYRLLTVGTVEEKVAKLQQSKRRLAEAILDAVPQSGEQISREDLESLLVE